jgi:rhamnose utilization protein RhaD (predicted bifunctional aldolase and dehydrogenase)
VRRSRASCAGRRSDPRNTNYAGGNASAKGTAADPVTGEDVELLWVKGSGGDLATLTPAGLAALPLDRLRALASVYPSGSRAGCSSGTAGASPRNS